ncbi:hypothetical protein M378DRAFT_635134 [Amanita muscaria Koide BX008]|uniref:Uncharacterized protein n=1 Tax=Amanita muscaria (strain Koide BX008) TaxID=946122 RepID=A0A0C2TBK3_AMAMK|nr:hypothetical protein M378DRAFT_635134 [Amanita muscaria Koide BX008]
MVVIVQYNLSVASYLHSLSHIAIVFWAEHSFASVLEEIDVVQDDVDISHPPDIPLFRFFSRHLVVNQPGHFDLHPLFGLVCLERQ